jgi:hypothetical protein
MSDVRIAKFKLHIEAASHNALSARANRMPPNQLRVQTPPGVAAHHLGIQGLRLKQCRAGLSG